MARERRKIVQISDAAAARARALLTAGDRSYLRVGVKNGGCAGMEYVLAYAEAPSPHDELVEDKGISILVAADSVLFLLGATIDFEETRFAQRFVFRNPNETDACGCGESVTIVPVSEAAAGAAPDGAGA